MARVVVGMLGLGTVGTGVVKLLGNHPNLVLKKVAVRNLEKAREVQPNCHLTDKVEEVVNDPEIEILIEVMGGENPALDLIKSAVQSRKHVVTANKEVLAKHGPSLLRLARDKQVAVFFEASVAGGIPLLSTIQKGLEANQISSVTGILNGTTNFILSQMEEKGEEYSDSLRKAQELGYAEADPTSDVEGFDVAYKLSILTALAFGRFVKPQEIFRKGISKIDAADLKQAAELGYRLKLLGCVERSNGDVSARVQPTLVPLSHPLANVSGANNGIMVKGHAVGEIMMMGPGAGQLPTASAVVGDVINLATALRLQDFASYFHSEISDDWHPVLPVEHWLSPYYLRLDVADSPGVIGKIGSIFGDNHVSIRSIIQKGVDVDGATVVIVTHPVKTGDLFAALETMKQEQFLREFSSCLPIFESGVKK